MLDLETALEFVNAALLAKEKRSLRPIEFTILQGAWKGQTYDQIAASSKYSYNYLMRDVGPRFWRLLSDIFGENVNKSNVRLVAEKLYFASQPNTSESLYYQLKTQFAVQESLLDRQSSQTPRRAICDWENAPPSFPEFVGYQQELNLLNRWVIKSHCHLVNLWGISGVGKTTLMREFARQVEPQYEFIVWRTLASAPKFTNFVASLPGFISRDLKKDNKNLTSQLVKIMRSHSCLILLDNVEAILQIGQPAGKYKPGYEDYGEFFQLVGESSHQSCIVVASQESLGGIFQFTGKNSLVRSLELCGLSELPARSLLNLEQSNRQASWQKLINYYQGNPAMLSIANKIIQELFNHNVAEFLAQESLVFGEINLMLQKSFSRLSVLEIEILYWLASEANPISLAEINASIPLSIYPGELLEAIKSLNQRSLIETHDSQAGSCFFLAPLIRHFTIDRLIAQLGNKGSTYRNTRYSPQQSFSNSLKINAANSRATHLSFWLSDRFELEWQSIDRLFPIFNQSWTRLRSIFNFRDQSIVKRFKQIKFNNLQTESVLLLMAIEAKEEVLRICVQIQPEMTQQVLPQNLKLSLIAADNSIVTETESQEQDDLIQLPYFYGEIEDRFCVKLALGSFAYVEEFVI